MIVAAILIATAVMAFASVTFFEKRNEHPPLPPGGEWAISASSPIRKDEEEEFMKWAYSDQAPIAPGPEWSSYPPGASPDLNQWSAAIEEAKALGAPVAEAAHAWDREVMARASWSLPEKRAAAEEHLRSLARVARPVTLEARASGCLDCEEQVIRDWCDEVALVYLIPCALHDDQ